MNFINEIISGWLSAQRGLRKILIFFCNGIKACGSGKLYKNINICPAGLILIP